MGNDTPLFKNNGTRVSIDLSWCIDLVNIESEYQCLYQNWLTPNRVTTGLLTLPII